MNSNPVLSPIHPHIKNANNARGNSAHYNNNFANNDYPIINQQQHQVAFNTLVFQPFNNNNPNNNNNFIKEEYNHSSSSFWIANKLKEFDEEEKKKLLNKRKNFEAIRKKGASSPSFSPSILPKNLYPQSYQPNSHRIMNDPINSPPINGNNNNNNKLNDIINFNNNFNNTFNNNQNINLQNSGTPNNIVNKKIKNLDLKLNNLQPSYKFPALSSPSNRGEVLPEALKMIIPPILEYEDNKNYNDNRNTSLEVPQYQQQPLLTLSPKYNVVHNINNSLHPAFRPKSPTLIGNTTTYGNRFNNEEKNLLENIDNFKPTSPINKLNISKKKGKRNKLETEVEQFIGLKLRELSNYNEKAKSFEGDCVNIEKKFNIYNEAFKLFIGKNDKCRKVLHQINFEFEKTIQFYKQKAELFPNSREYEEYFEVKQNYDEMKQQLQSMGVSYITVERERTKLQQDNESLKRQLDRIINDNATLSQQLLEKDFVMNEKKETLIETLKKITSKDIELIDEELILELDAEHRKIAEMKLQLEHERKEKEKLALELNSLKQFSEPYEEIKKLKLQLKNRNIEYLALKAHLVLQDSKFKKLEKELNEGNLRVDEINQTPRPQYHYILDKVESEKERKFLGKLIDSGQPTQKTIEKLIWELIEARRNLLEGNENQSVGIGIP
ncbi:hypothetical protein ABK040_013944 [Willaertia magna]